MGGSSCRVYVSIGIPGSSKGMTVPAIDIYEDRSFLEEPVQFTALPPELPSCAVIS